MHLQWSALCKLIHPVCDTESSPIVWRNMCFSRLHRQVSVMLLKRLLRLVATLFSQCYLLLLSMLLLRRCMCCGGPHLGGAARRCPSSLLATKVDSD